VFGWSGTACLESSVARLVTGPLIVIDHRKRGNIANVAIARELAGWCWSLAVMEN
jgi:hypothetical protein